MSQLATAPSHSTIDAPPQGPESMVFITPTAAAKVNEIRNFDEVAEVDRQIEIQGVQVVVDEMSLMYLVGTEIDYVEGLQGAGFKFNNPNVKSTCGCGSSFSV